MIQPLLAAAMVLSQAAAPAPQSCLTRPEAADVALVMLPGVIDGAASKCASALPRDAFLRTGSRAMAERLRRESAKRASQAIAAFAKLGDEPMPSGVSEATMKQLVEEVAAGAIVEGIKVRDCAAVNEVVEALAPLPAPNLATVVAVLMELGGKTESDSSFRMCAAGR
ncbi:MAG TPA: hypothetical protein VGW34_00835 [Allosphingosinicella sp.]|nr:hypothetical protein [Allosphingosinicella sp.]